MSDDIKKKLAELDRLREALSAKLAETSAVLTEVDKSINSVDLEQAEHLSAPTKEAALTSADALLKRTEDNLKMRLIPDGLTMEQISVGPGERMLDRKSAFSEMIDASPAAVVLKDAGGKFLYANRTVHKFYDIPMGTMVGTTDKNWSLATEAHEYQRNDEQVIRTKQSLDALEIATNTKGETTYWFSHRFPLTGKLGTLVAIIALEVSDLVNTSGPERAAEIAGARIQNMEILKQQLIRYANQTGLA